MNISASTRLFFIVNACLAPAIHAQVSNNNDASARPSDDVVELSAFEVSTSRDIGYQSTNAAEVTRMNTPIEDIPMNISIFNQEFLTDILAVQTEDVLAYDASFTKTDENDGFKSRGFGVNANYIDGFKQAEGMGSHSVASAERVEVIKGPAAVLWGQGGFGAVVNRISKRPKWRPSSNVRLIAGAWDTFAVQVDDTRPLPVAGGNKLAYRMSIDWRDGNVYRGTYIKRIDITPSLLWQPSKWTKINLSYIYSLNERQGGWAFPLHSTSMPAFPGLLPGNRHGMYDAGGHWHDYGDYKMTHVHPDDARRLVRNVASIDVQQTFSRHLQFHGQFQYEDRSRKDYELQPEITYLTFLKDAVLIPRRYREQFRDDDNYRVRAELLGQFKTGTLSHKLIGGYAWDRWDYDRDNRITPANQSSGMTQGVAVFPDVSFADFLADPALAGFRTNRVLPLNAFDPDNSPAVPDRSTLALNQDVLQDVKIDNSEFYANEVLGLFHDRVNIQGGVRRTDTKRTVHNLKNGNTTFSNPDATTYSVGGVWHLDKNRRFTLYANMNSSFEPNFQTQPDGSFLEPTTGDQKEIGLRYNLAEGRFQGLVSWFDIKQNNVPVEDSDTGWYHQISDQRSKGVEVALNFRPAKSWDVFGSYAYTDARTTDLTRGITGIPQYLQARHVATLFNNYKFLNGPFKGLSLRVTLFYRGSRPSEHATGGGYVRPEGDWTIPSAFSMDAGASYNLRLKKRKSINIGFRIKNIFNNTERYFVAYQDRMTPDPGREWDVFLGYKY
jgi:outer membrane receptor protein involved in Fe transport